MLKGGVLGCVSLPVLALLALLRGRSGKGPLNVLLRFLPSESTGNDSKTCVSAQPADRSIRHASAYALAGMKNMEQRSLQIWLVHSHVPEV